MIMDHNLDDSLNLEGAMGVDFEQPDSIIVSEAEGMTLEHEHEGSIPMEFEHTEEQPVLMDTSSEEIIVSDFMGDQFTLQEYSVQSDQTTGLTTTVESNEQHMLTQSESMLDLQFQPQLESSIKTEVKPHKLIAVKAAPQPVSKKSDIALASLPRQVAIAPKPPKLISMKHYPALKQLAIAPKPLNMTSRGQSLVKKVSIANVAQGAAKGNSVLAQIGKQLIMMPSGSQKVKLVPSSGAVSNIQYIRADSDQTQMVASKNVSTTKPLVTKLFAVQGKPPVDLSNQSAVITKILPAGGGKGPRYVTVPSKSVPISLGNKVLMATPAKQGGMVKLTKKQEIITIKSPTTKLLPSSTLVAVSNSTSPVKSKVIISNAKNVIIKPNDAPKTEIPKVTNVMIDNQKSQLHQINVPGKGVQYVRIFSNPTPAQTKTVTKPVVLNPKTFVLTDNKGNIIQMSEKMTPGQASSVVVTGNANPTALKTQHKLVRLAPVVQKIAQANMQTARSSQSLLAPLSPVQTTESTTLPEISDVRATILEEQPEQSEDEDQTEVGAEAEAVDEAEAEEEEVDSKAALRQLVENTIAEDAHFMNEIEIEYKQQREASPPLDTSTESVQHDSSDHSEEKKHLIVLPNTLEQHQPQVAEQEQDRLDDLNPAEDMANLDEEAMNNTYQSSANATSDPDVVSSDFGLRPRKACNCTKSQCLKLYCDCFANGEFCNRCNCVNCHNNLDNEELRQKAIRSCLDRNPNAFRPKIGKTKSGGPEIIRRHNKGCNCKRSGCLKNYCECYEAKIACTPICKCVGCRNVEETLERRHRSHVRLLPVPPPPPHAPKQPCSFMTSEVIEAVCQCLLAAGVEHKEEVDERGVDPMRDVIEEFARCLQDIISAAHHSKLDEEELA